MIRSDGISIGKGVRAYMTIDKKYFGNGMSGEATIHLGTLNGFVYQVQRHIVPNYIASDKNPKV